MIKIKPKAMIREIVVTKTAPLSLPMVPTAEVIFVTKRGRPSTGKAMTNAQRQAKFKALKKEHGNG